MSDNQAPESPSADAPPLETKDESVVAESVPESAPQSERDTVEESAPESAPESAAETSGESPEAPAEAAKEGTAEESTKPAPKVRPPQHPALARAFRTRRPVRGAVESVIKGGFEIHVGKARAFCPFSQMDVARVEKPEDFIGQTLLFRVIQFRRGGDDIVLSRRLLIEEERGEEQKAVRATLVEGGITRGHVKSIVDFGVFIDLGAGVIGLVHVSELAHGRVPKPADVVKVGDEVDVRVIKVDDARGRISLSIKQAQEDPWKAVADRFAVGSVHRGKVLRVADFGAFVELAPGVEALAAGRDFPPSDKMWQETAVAGFEGTWQVLSVERKRRRMSLVLTVGDDPYPMPELNAGSTVTGKVQRVEKFGVFVWLGPGRVGLVPASWTGVPRGTRMETRFKPGADVEVEIVDVTEGGRRIRLGFPGVERPEPQESAPRPQRRDESRSRETKEETGTFGTSLADVLKAAMGKDS